MILHAQGGVIVPFFKSYVYARRSDVHHDPHPTGTWPLDGYRAAERWWFAS